MFQPMVTDKDVRKGLWEAATSAGLCVLFLIMELDDIVMMEPRGHGVESIIAQVLLILASAISASKAVWFFGGAMVTQMKILTSNNHQT